MKKQTGLTLIELMIVVAILTVLATIGYPLYQGQVYKARRIVAKEALIESAQLLERCAAEYLRYNDAGCSVSLPYDAPTDSTTKYYTISADSLTASTFTLRATAISGQVNDSDCSFLTLDYLGQTTAEDSKCW